MAGLSEDGGEGGKAEKGSEGYQSGGKISMTFIFRPLVASEASRWSRISSLEARSPFVYSIRIPARSPIRKLTRNYQKAKGLA